METILVVDDEKNYLLVLSAVLEEEGYEDEETIAMLIKMGVDFGQGYYFSKPVNVDDKHWLTADLV